MSSRQPRDRVRPGPLLVAVAVSALAVGACSQAPVPPPRAANWPAPLVETDEDVALWEVRFIAQVDTPAQALGPQTDHAIDPRVVEGISWTGSAWKMQRDWDENADGGYLDFGAAALDVNDHRVLGFRIEVPAGRESGHVIDGGGEIGYFEVTNPGRLPSNSYIRLVSEAHHYIALGVAGDAIKVGEGFSYHHDAYIEMGVPSGGASDKHYDGAQIFGSGSARLERLVIDWNDAGTLASTTGALFTQDEASLEARDIIVLNPGGTWQPIRFAGSGLHDVDEVQVTGARRPNVGQPETLAPTALVRISNGSDLFTLYNEVPGASDWVIPEPS